MFKQLIFENLSLCEKFLFKKTPTAGTAGSNARGVQDQQILFRLVETKRVGTLKQEDAKSSAWHRVHSVLDNGK